MAEGMEARPRNACLSRSGLQHSPTHVVDLERCSDAGHEHWAIIVRPFALDAMPTKSDDELMIDRDVAPAVASLERTQTAANEALANLDVRLRSVELEVSPLESDRLRDANAGC